MADITSLIARPPGFDYRTLADPLEGYMQGRDANRQMQLQNEFSQGLPRGADGQIDWARAVEKMADSQAKFGSNPTNAAQLVLQGRQMQEDSDFASRLERLATPQGASRPAAVSSQPPQAAAPTGGPATSSDPSYTIPASQAASANNQPIPTPEGVPLPQPRPPQAGQQAGAPQPTGAQTQDPEVAQQVASLTALLARARTPQQATAIQTRLNQLQPDRQIMTTPEGTIISIDKRTGAVTPIYQAPKLPTFGRTGGSSEEPQYGFIDPNTRTVSNVGGAPAEPNNPYAQPGKTTDEQAKAGLYTSRMLEAEQILRKPAIVDAATNLTQRGLGAIPVLGNFAFTESGKAYQSFDQAQRNFINAVLRRESGAVIAESEFANAKKQYFPQPGDTSQQINQKRMNREEAIRGIAAGAGRGYIPPAIFNEAGNLVPNPKARRTPQDGQPQQQQPQRQPTQAAQAAPAPDARQAPDGNWYVETEPGKFSRVDPQ